MRKALKYTSIAAAALIILVAAAIFFIWHSITPNRIRTILNTQLSSAKTKGIVVFIDKININKQFPNLLITVDNLSIKSKNIKASAINPYVSLNVIKFAFAKISGKNYFGKIGVSKVYVKVTQNEAKPKNREFTFPKIPYIPVELYIPKTNIKINQITLNGQLNLTDNLLTKSNSLYFKGTINKIQLSLKLEAQKNRLAFEAKIPNIREFGALAKAIELNGNLNKNLDFSINSKIGLFKFKSLLLAGFSSKIIGKINKNTLKIEDLNSKSKNGFILHLNGLVNIKHPMNSLLSGSISTPFIDISQFFYLLPKSIKPYLGSAMLSLKSVKFSGQPSLSFVKNGLILIRDVNFRINPNNPFFNLSTGKVQITKDKIIAIASGIFDKIKAKNSSFILYRRNGFRSDIHLNLYGTATELVRLFVEENLLSKSDLKLLGKSKNLNGSIKAKIDVYSYRFKPKPYFDFSLKLYPKNIEFLNPNIPNHWIKASGYVEINRLTKNGKVTSLYLLFKNFTAQTKGSQFKTDKLKITIKPKLGFYGQINAKISRNELNFLERSIAKETDKLKFKWIKINGDINGTVNNFLFSTNLTIPIKFKGIALNTNISGLYSNGILTIKKLTAKGIGNLYLSGIINVKQKKIINLKAKANELKISSIQSLLPIVVSGIISGELDLSITQTLNIKKANLTIKNGELYGISNLNADIKSYGNSIVLSNASFDFLNNHIIADGEYNLNSQSIKLNLFSQKLTFDTDKILKKKSKKHNKNITIHLPNQNIIVRLSTLDFVLKNKKKTKDLKATKIKFFNDSETTDIRLESPFSNWTTNINKTKKLIKITAKDSAIWPFLTDCSNKENNLSLDVKLHYKNKNAISLKNLTGDIDFTAKDGCIPNAPTSIKLFTLLNPFSMFLKGVDLSKGIQYELIHAHLKLNNNILKTKENDAAIIKGKSVDIFAYGKYDLIKSKIDVYVTFITFSTINKIISHIPIIGWIVAGKNRSFTGLSFHVYGSSNSPTIKPIPFKNLAKGVLGVVKRTIMLPLSIFGVK